MAGSLLELVLEPAPAGAGVQIGPRSIDRFVVQMASPAPAPNAAWWDAGLWDAQLWSTGTWAWVDVTCDVREVDCERGRDSPLERFRVGVARIVLANRDRKYSTIDPPASSPYVVAGRSILGAGTIMRIGYMSDNGWQATFTGVCEQWSDVPDYTTGDEAANVTLTETTADLATIDRPAVAPIGNLDAAQPRLDRLLEDAGWRWPRRYNNGLAGNLQATTMAGNRLAECYLSADSILEGRFYADVDGAARYDGTGWLPGIPVGTISGAVPGDLNPVEMILADDTLRMVNDVSYSRVGGTVQRVVDSASRERFGTFTGQRLDLIATADAKILELATAAVTRGAWDVRRVDGFTLNYPASIVAPGAPLTLCRFMAQVQLRNLVNLRLSSGAITSTVEAVRHHLRFGGTPPEWEVSISVQRQDPAGPYT